MPARRLWGVCDHSRQASRSVATPAVPMRAFYLADPVKTALASWHVGPSYKTIPALIGAARLMAKETPPIAKRLKKLREAANLRQEDLAARAGLSVSAICKIEQGNKADPRVSTAIALARALGVSCEELVGPGRPRARNKRALRLR
jgi:DNA-binding XRE family transcriptional regulator